jgi:hypothetical protein
MRVAELVFKGTNRTVIKALDQIARDSEKTASRVKRSSAEEQTAVGKVGKSAEHTRGLLSGLAGIGGFAGLAFGIKDVVTAGMSFQASQAQLQGSLQRTGQASAENMRKLNEAADRLAQHGGFGAIENVQSLTQLVTATGSVTKAMRDQQLATDIARRTGRNYGSVVKALQMLEAGRLTGLSRLGIIVPKVTTAEDALKRARGNTAAVLQRLAAQGIKVTASQRAQFEMAHKITPAMVAQAKVTDGLASRQAALAVLQQRFGGATDKFAKSTAGKLSSMRNQWKILTEQLGSALLPTITKLVAAGSAVVGWLNKNRIVLYGLLGALAAVTTVLGIHKALMGVLAAKTYVLAAAQRILGTTAVTTAGEEDVATVSTIAWGTAMDALPILALIAGLVFLATHTKETAKVITAAWKWIGSAATAAWGAISSGASAAFGWIKGHWPLLAGILLAPFTFGLSLIPGLFGKQIVGAARATIGWLAGAWRVVWNILTWPFKEAWKVIKGIIGGIKSAIGFVLSLPGKAVNAVGSVLSTVTGGLLAGGGPVRAKYLATGGPAGSDTVPAWLTPGEGVVNTRGMSGLGAAGLASLNAGSSAGNAETLMLLREIVTAIREGKQIVISGRVLAEEVTRATQQRAARGAGQLVGGALMTGARA